MRGLFEPFDLYYYVGGAGTPADPANIAFRFTGQPRSLVWLRGLFPNDTVLEEVESGRFVLKGRSPIMSRAELSHTFITVLRSQRWKGKGEDA